MKNKQPSHRRRQRQWRLAAATAATSGNGSDQRQRTAAAAAAHGICRCRALPLPLAAVAAAFFGCMGKSRVEYRVMAMELTVGVGRANFRWKRYSFMIMVGSRTPNKQQRSYAGSRRCAAGVV